MIRRKYSLRLSACAVCVCAWCVSIGTACDNLDTLITPGAAPTVVAQAAPALSAPPPVAPPPAIPRLPGVGEAPPAGNDQQQPSQDSAAPFDPLAAPAAPATPADPNAPDPAADLYGTQGGEQVLTAEEAPQDAPLRARKGDTFFVLSNPRINNNRPGLPALAVDYERVHDGEHNGVSLIIKDADGNSRTVMIFGPMWDKKGTIEVEQRFPVFNGPAFPDNCELYFLRSDHRYSIKRQPTFKVSNSAVRGNMPKLTLARAWTADEAARLRKPPPNFNNYNAFPNVGHDTKFVGDTTGGAAFRTLDPNLPLLGVEYRVGAWDNEQCIGQLVPVFSADQEVTYEPRIIAKDGYAVGGMNVFTKRFVNAVQLVFMKIKPDGSLDPKDSYEGEWFGYPPEEVDPVLLGGDGRRVIGLHVKQGAILNGFALVMDKALVKRKTPAKSGAKPKPAAKAKAKPAPAAKPKGRTGNQPIRRPSAAR